MSERLDRIEAILDRIEKTQKSNVKKIDALTNGISQIGQTQKSNVQRIRALTNNLQKLGKVCIQRIEENIKITKKNREYMFQMMNFLAKKTKK